MHNGKKVILEAKLSFYIATISLPEATVYFLCLCCCRWAVLRASQRASPTCSVQSHRHSWAQRDRDQALSRKQVWFPWEVWFSLPASLVRNMKKPQCMQGQCPWELSASLKERKQSHSVTHGISFPLHQLGLWQSWGSQNGGMIGLNFSPLFLLKEIPLSYHCYLGFRIKVKCPQEFTVWLLPFRQSEYVGVI